MNNSKWREVFREIVRHNIAFEAAWVGQPVLPSTSAYTYRLHSEDLIDDAGLRDPGIGGPRRFRDILWLRFPRTIDYDNGRGHVRRLRQDLSPFLRALAGIGVLPVTEAPDHVELLAYATPKA